MTAVARAFYAVATHSCIPATCEVVATFVLTVKAAGKTVHLYSLAAHVATLLVVQVGRVLYLEEHVECRYAVFVQNYAEISADCWIHVICFNIFLSFKYGSKTRTGCVNTIFNLAYVWCVPLAIMFTLERYISGSRIKIPGVLYDVKTCVLDQGSLQTELQNDASLNLSIIRGVSLLLIAILHLCLCYNIAFRKRNALLCEDDADSFTYLSATQKQVVNYVLVIAATGVMGILADLGSWYSRRQQTVLPNKHIQEVTSAVHDLHCEFGVRELLFKGLSLTFDFLRIIVISVIVCCEGRKDSHQIKLPQFEDGLPPYEEATRQANLTTAAMLDPPPSYSSIVGNRNIQDELLLESVEPAFVEAPAVI